MKKVFLAIMTILSLTVFMSCTDVELTNEDYTDTFVVDPSDDGTIDNEDYREGE
ncbi:hypothetical protein KORDIASMS9_01792 [Kordia sp. SMS9]|nr:hypothetical protein KORDIASMS9_01792 [Kordia sp. SMS9]